MPLLYFNLIFAMVHLRTKPGFSCPSVSVFASVEMHLRGAFYISHEHFLLVIGNVPSSRDLSIKTSAYVA